MDISAGARSLLAAARRGDVSCAEVAEQALAGLDRVVELNGLAFRDDDSVRARAVALDAQRARGHIGALHGLPVSVKDWIETTPFPCAAGHPQFAERRPARDATVVARLRAAGALIVATSAVGPASALHGRPRNPLDPTRTPGHSSAGEGVMLRCGVAAVGIGSDSGGSIRFPAHCCGLVGLRPTYGRVPVTGHFPRVGALADGRTVIGPLARHVDDIRLVLPVIAGPDGHDPACPPVPIGTEPASVAGLRVAVHTHTSSGGLEPEVAAMVDRLAAVLSAAGCEVTHEPDVLRVERALDITQRYWSRARLGAGEVEKLLADWDRFRVESMRLLARYDAILSPTCPHPAPPLGVTDDSDWTYLLTASLCGWPAISVPAGSTNDGLPLGAQIVAGPWAEGTCLALATVIEAAGTADYV